jgi:hypothetical protein
MIRPLLLHAPIPPSRGVRVFQILLQMVPAEFSLAPHCLFLRFASHIVPYDPQALPTAHYLYPPEPYHSQA